MSNRILVRLAFRALMLVLGVMGAGQFAGAALVVVTLTGTVSSGTDTTGVFGPPNSNLAGQPYIAIFTYDDTKGTTSTGSCADGTPYYSILDPTSTSSPGIATLSIGGSAPFPIGGGAFGQTQTNFSYALMYAKTSCFSYSEAGYGVQVSYASGGFYGTSYVGTASGPYIVPAAGTQLSTSANWEALLPRTPLDSRFTFGFNIDVVHNGVNYAVANGYLSEGTLTVSGPETALRFVPMTPCRIADSRMANGPFGGPKLAAGSSRDFVIPNSSCGIPSTAAAYSLNVTVVPDAQLGYLSMYPTGQIRPVVSTLNSDGRIKANAALVPAGSGGGVTVYASDATQVILDVSGYFVPAASSISALAFYPVAPCRVADTRGAMGTLGAPYLSAGEARSFPILSSSCNLPATAQAYSLNFTAVPHGSLGFLTAWPTGQQQPGVSTLNASTGAVTANAALLTAGSNGDISVYTTDDADLLIDVDGYFAPPGANGLSLYPVPPCRSVDTRYPAGSPAFNGTLAANMFGSGCSAPPSAQAYVLNATLVPPGQLSYLTLWPQGQARPVVSTLNAFDGAITSNMAIVPTTNGLIDAFGSNPTYLILDLSGYFAP